MLDNIQINESIYYLREKTNDECKKKQRKIMQKDHLSVFKEINKVKKSYKKLV